LESFFAVTLVTARFDEKVTLFHASALVSKGEATMALSADVIVSFVQTNLPVSYGRPTKSQPLAGGRVFALMHHVIKRSKL
jgi:hypothetical protein